MVKEVRYFDHGWARPWEWYLAHFPPRAMCAPRTITGEASPFYLAHPESPARVAARLPDVKLIVLLRDPVRRAISHYFHEVRAGWETRPIGEAMWAAQSWHLPDVQAIETGSGRSRQLSVRRSYIARGLYADQLQNWLQHFDRDRMLVLQSEGLRQAPHQCYAKALSFLALEQADIGPFEEMYVGKYGKADPNIVTDLRAFYAEPNRRLSELLGMKFSWPTK
jgi:hypothetical protein